MPSIQKLAELSTLASASVPLDEAMKRALPVVQASLGAEDVFLVYGAEAGFQCFGSCPELELGDIALWLINRDLTTRKAPCAFDLEAGHVVNFRDAGSRGACRYIAALVPMASGTGEMLIARGSWPNGLGRPRVQVLRAALPTVAMLLDRRLDSSRAERQRNQLNALANITRVMSRAEDLETVLTSIAGTIASVAGIDYISIDIVDSSGNVELRVTNSIRPGVEAHRERWNRGAARPDPVRDAVLITRSPMIFPDAQNDERIPEKGRAFFIRTLIRSTATFPLLAKDDVLGVLSVASHRPLDFSPQEMELLEGLAAQAAAAVKGIQLYQELADSREELQRLNQQLQESMGIEHHLARTDALTGIPNRRFIDESIAMEVARANRYGHDVSVVMADLDNLKDINDTYGHQAGDEILRFAAELARQSCRQVDVVGRYGGDEFVFVLPATKLEQAAQFAERFRQRLAASPAPNHSEDPLYFTVSLGVAHWESESLPEPSALVRQADRAMYRAKAAGRNRTVVAAGEAVHVA